MLDFLDDLVIVTCTAWDWTSQVPRVTSPICSAAAIPAPSWYLHRIFSYQLGVSNPSPVLSSLGSRWLIISVCVKAERLSPLPPTYASPGATCYQPPHIYNGEESTSSSLICPQPSAATLYCPHPGSPLETVKANGHSSSSLLTCSTQAQSSSNIIATHCSSSWHA